MKIARGNTRKIVKLVGEIQTLVGSAKGTVLNDRNPNMMDDLLPMLDRAFGLCLDVTGMYEPIRERANTARTRHSESGGKSPAKKSNRKVTKPTVGG